MRLAKEFFALLALGLLGQSDGSVNELLDQARSALRSGEYEIAMDAITNALGKDSDNLVAYDLRATIYQAVGRTKQAVADLSQVNKLDPTRTKAWVKKAGLELRLGQLDDAEKSLERGVGEQDHATVSEALQMAKEAKKEAVKLFSAQQYNQALEHLNKLIEVAKEDPEIREMRAEANMQLGNKAEAIGDYLRVTRLTNDNTEAFYRVSQLYYQDGEAEQSLVQIRECLKLDPDHKVCRAHYKKVKKLAQQVTRAQTSMDNDNWMAALGELEAANHSTTDSHAFQKKFSHDLCTCYVNLNQGKATVTACSIALAMDPDNSHLLCNRAEGYIKDDMLQPALDDYQRAVQLDSNNQRAQQGVARVQKLLKQAKKRDYYAILGVRRDATKKEVTKAYRRLALEWHPDKYEGADKKLAEKKFMDISDAKEVLMDPEKRQQFDNGIDPLDAEDQRPPPHPFGFNPFFQQGAQGQHFHTFFQNGGRQQAFHFHYA